jgi:hypothetical protein
VFRHVEVYIQAFLTFTLSGAGDQLYNPATLPPDNHWRLCGCHRSGLSLCSFQNSNITCSAYASHFITKLSHWLTSKAALFSKRVGGGDTKFKCKHITYHLKTTEVHRNVEILSYGNDRTSTRNHLYYKTVSRPALWLEISAWIVLKLNHEVTILFTAAKLQHSSSLNLKTDNSIKCMKIKMSLGITACCEHKQKTHRQTSFQPNLCNRCQW